MHSLTDNALAFLTSAGAHGKILLTLFIVLLAAKLMAELFERLRQPAVVGEILAGVILGPSLLNFISSGGAVGATGGTGMVIEALAEIGVVAARDRLELRLQQLREGIDRMGRP
jgi:predicted Kef-type K+ transport protein